MTRYEIAARHPDGRQYLIAYAVRVSRPGLMDALRGVGEAIIQKCEVGGKDMMSFHTTPRIHAAVSGWTIGFTGRTQLQAKSEGELAWVGA